MIDSTATIQAALGLGPVSEARLSDPLEYLLAEHRRQRHLCDILRRIAEAGSASASECIVVARYLDHEIKLHHRDETEDLFPALRRRAKPEDNIDGVLDRLAADHRRIEATAATLAAALARAGVGSRVEITPLDRGRARGLATMIRGHLAIENSVFVALAQVRLTASDLSRIARSMTARHRMVS